MRTVRVPRKPVVLIAVNSHEMPTVPAGLDQSSPRPSLAWHLLTRMGGAGERFGPDYIWVSWVGGKDLAPGALTPALACRCGCASPLPPRSFAMCQARL